MVDRHAILQPEDSQPKELRHETYTQRETRSKTKSNTKEYNYKTPKIRSTELNKPAPVETTTETAKSNDGVKAITNPDITPEGAVNRNITDAGSRSNVKMTQPVKEDNQAKISPVVYKSRAPVESGLDIEKLVETVLDLEIKIPLRSLAGVSSVIQNEIRKQMTKTRHLVELAENTAPKRQYIRLEDVQATFSQRVYDTTSEGCIVADDPVLQYLTDHASVDPSDLIVGNTSEPLRAIYTTINQVGQEECLLDNGSMIVSMAKEVAIQLGLTWDPSIQINMESASNHIEKTLGLARNVSFTVGGIDLLLQVHILEAPPYRVLLGRPFDTHASSIIQTRPDGASELVLTDPNTKRIAIIPTYKRGVGPEELQKQKYQSF